MNYTNGFLLQCLLYRCVLHRFYAHLDYIGITYYGVSLTFERLLLLFIFWFIGVYSIKFARAALFPTGTLFLV